MKKWFAINVTLLVSLLLVSCEQAPEFPKMTAPEVCQYVNQALPNEYIPYTPVIRFEYRYTALSAEYGKAEYGKAEYGKEVVDEEMNHTIKALSPEALRIFREEIPERLKAMTPQDREAALSRLRGIAEVEDIVQEFEGIHPEGTWLVNVKVVVEPQRLTEGNWVATPLFETKEYVEQYYFSEVTGAIKKR